MTFLVISNFHGKIHVAKEYADPRESLSYKGRQQDIIQIVRLTARGAGLPLSILNHMYLEGVFDRPSGFWEAEKPKVVETPKPPKNQIAGGQ